MILTDIKQYLIMHRQATLCDLSNHFDVDPDAMKGMLDQWVRKGKVSRSDVINAGCCKTCAKCCNDTAMEVYEWIS